MVEGQAQAAWARHRQGGLSYLRAVLVRRLCGAGGPGLLPIIADLGDVPIVVTLRLVERDLRLRAGSSRNELVRKEGQDGLTEGLELGLDLLPIVPCAGCGH